MHITPYSPSSLQSAGGQNRQVGEKLEQAFLEEMLKYAGPKPSDHAFGGGIGEEQFSTFLTREYAAVLADSLDLGLGVDERAARDA